MKAPPPPLKVLVQAESTAEYCAIKCLVSLFKRLLSSFVCRDAAWARLCARDGDRSPVQRGGGVHSLESWLVPAPCASAVAKHVKCLATQGQAGLIQGMGIAFALRTMCVMSSSFPFVVVMLVLCCWLWSTLSRI